MQEIGQNQRRRVCFVQFTRWRHQSDDRQRCVIEIATWQHRAKCTVSDRVLLSGKRLLIFGKVALFYVTNLSENRVNSCF